MFELTTITNDTYRSVNNVHGFRFNIPSVAPTGELASAFTADGSTADLTGATNGKSFQVGARVQLTTTTTLPAPFALVTDYYVVGYVFSGPGATIQLSATQGGSPIVTTDTGTGTHTMTTYAVSEEFKLTLASNNGILKSVRLCSQTSTDFDFSVRTKAGTVPPSVDEIYTLANVNKVSNVYALDNAFSNNDDTNPAVSNPYIYIVITNNDATNETGDTDCELIFSQS